LIAAVIFDLDGLLLDSESVWDEARRDYVAEHGGRWRDEATRAMMGMSSVEWSRYGRDELEVDRDASLISAEVAARVGRLYRERLPLMPGATEAVERIGARWPLGLASSSNREVIDLVLELSEFGPRFEVTVSSEEVEHGKPAPDVYLETARRMSVEPSGCAAIEDYHNGIQSAKGAGMRVIAIPNPRFAPSPEALEVADRVIASLDELTPGLVGA